ncbi:MAG TPA: hypothetical protein VHY20_00085 [Pirellulales bacterium]|nr:hypothetical protein [Pirellulales bacterium]
MTKGASSARGRALQAALLAGLATIAWQPAGLQADPIDSGVQTAGWHAAGTQTGEIQQLSYTEPCTSPVDNNATLRWTAHTKKRPVESTAFESPAAKRTAAKPTPLTKTSRVSAKPTSEIQQVTYTEPCVAPRANSGKLRWKARPAKQPVDEPAAQLTSAVEPALEPVPSKSEPVASISSSSRKTVRYQWGKLGFDPWGDLGLGPANSGDEEKSTSQDVDEDSLASLSTVQQAEGRLPIDPGDEAPRAKHKSVPPLAIPAGDGLDESDEPGFRTAQRRTSPSMPQMPSFEDAFAQGPQSLDVDCGLERQKLKPINAITNKIAAEPGDFPPECNLGDPPYRPRCYPEMVYAWKASNLCHKPLYFEQYAVERYGHALPPVIQPLASGAHFFVDVLLLPYHMGLELPQECVYSLGYYRPGDCAPMHIDGFPISARAAVFQAGAILSGGAIFGSL